MAWAWNQNLPATPKFVLIAVADYARLNPEYRCWASLHTLAERCGMNVRTIRRILQDLVRCHFIEKVGSMKNGVRIYQLAVGQIRQWIGRTMKAKGEGRMPSPPRAQDPPTNTKENTNTKRNDSEPTPLETSILNLNATIITLAETIKTIEPVKGKPYGHRPRQFLDTAQQRALDRQEAKSQILAGRLGQTGRVIQCTPVERRNGDPLQVVFEISEERSD